MSETIVWNVHALGPRVWGDLQPKEQPNNFTYNATDNGTDYADKTKPDKRVDRAISIKCIR